MERNFRTLFNLFEDDFFSSVLKKDYSITSNDDKYYLSILTPGIDKSEINISIDGTTLKIEYKNTDEIITPFKIGSFKKLFQLSDDIKYEEKTAESNNGILTIILPKKEKQIKNIIIK